MDENTSAEVVRFMIRLAAHLKPRFPAYAGAILDEVQGKRMTNDKWNRLAAVLSSLAAIPGSHLTREDHDARNPALAAVVVAQQMAAATFGGRIDPKERADFALWYSKEIDCDISQKGS